MRQRSTELMQKILEFVNNFILEENASPTMSDIGTHFSIDRSTAYRYLVEMDKRGMITYDGRKIHSVALDAVHAVRPAVFYEGEIPCGTPEELETAPAQIVPLPTCLFGNKDLYLLKTVGDSMINCGICKGDYVVVERTQAANVGDIVVALCENANTLKRLLYDEEADEYILHPENDEMENIHVKNLQIQGVAKFVIKALK